ncbi:unnamed protein product, partial [Rotaria sp. Silwood1]
MPGSMDGIIRDTLELSSDRKVGGRDNEIGLAYNPEFIALGQVIKDMLNPDFILIGESDKRIGDTLQVLYSKIISKQPLTFQRMNFINAEITKIAINTYAITSNLLISLLAKSHAAEHSTTGVSGFLSVTSANDASANNDFAKAANARLSLGKQGPPYAKAPFKYLFPIRESQPTAALTTSTSAPDKFSHNSLS